MHGNTVQEIVALEQEIKAMLEAERLRLAAELERYVRESEEELAQHLQTLQTQEQAEEAEARRTAETAAEQVQARAEAYAAHLAAFSDGQLEDLLWKHLQDILPELP